MFGWELRHFLYSNHQLKNGSQSKKGCLILDVKPFIETYVGNLSFYHTQDFTITVLLHHIETSGTELFRNMSFYSVIIVVLCLLCISDLYLTLPVCLDKKTSSKPQLPSVSLILPQLRKKTGSSPVPLQRWRHTHLLYTHAGLFVCSCATLTSEELSGLHGNTRRSLRRRTSLSVCNSKHQCHMWNNNCWPVC